MKHILIVLCSLIFTFGCLPSVVAQSPRFYSSSHGLPSTRIKTLSFDRDWFLWITTEHGLSRFNGNDFTVYPANRNSINALHESNVSCIYEDPQGRTWVGAMDGLYAFSRTENRFTYHELSLIEGERVSVSDVKSIPGDPDRMIVSSYGRGLYVFDAKNETLDTLATSQVSTIVDRYKNVLFVRFDSQNRLWVVSSKGVQVCDLAQNQPIPFQGRTSVLGGLSNLSFNCLVEDTAKQLMYAATLEGNLFCIEEQGMQLTELPMLDHIVITSLLLDEQDKLLIGTENRGLFRYDLVRHTLQQVQFANCPIDLTKTKVHSIAYDNERNLWLALYQKGLLVVPSGNPDITHQSITDASATNLGCVSCFAEQPGGMQVLGMDGSGIMVKDRQGNQACLNTDNSVLESNSVLDLVTDNQGGTYVATYNGGVYYLEPCGESLSQGKMPVLRQVSALNFTKKVRAMCVEFDQSTGNLYIGTNGEGVYSYDPVSEQLHQYDVSIFNKWIVSLCIDSQHHLWVGTQNGLGLIDLNHNVIRMVSGTKSLRVFDITECGSLKWLATDQGLMSYNEQEDRLESLPRPGERVGEEMAAIQSSGDSLLWMTSSSGLFAYHIPTQRFHSYTCDEVRQVGDFAHGAVSEWSDGTICFGGDNGIITFSPSVLSQSISGPVSDLYFTQLWINNSRVFYDPDSEENKLDASIWHASELTLQPDDGAFLIRFSVRDYNNPRGVKYQYRLLGLERDWQTVREETNLAYYKHLPYGKYTLQVRAYRDESELASGNFAYRELRINVLSPWYLSWWMIAIYILIMLVTGWAVFIHLRQRSHEKRVLQQTEQERRVNAEKLRFFTSLTHEFQTPAALLLATLKRLMEHKTDNATASIYEIMHRNVMRILMLADQQLDLRKIDNGQLHLRMQPIELHPFLLEQMQYYRNLSASMLVLFDLDAPDTSITLWADPNEMDKVVMNLLSNAFKFVNREGKVLVSVSQCKNHGLLPNVEASEVIQIEIFNSGSSINENEMSDIFKRFYKGADTNDNGSGIGLNVAYELTQLQHGALSVRNDAVRGGVAFTITMPLGDMHLSESERYVAPMAEEEKPVVQSSDELSPDPYEDEQKMAVFDADSERKLLQKYSLNIDYSQIKLESQDEKLLQRVQKCINRNLGDSSFGVEQLSQEVGISRVHLNRKLREMLDVTPSNLIKTIRLRQATYLLVQNNVSVAEVAYRVGFSSPSYFTSNFTQYFGMTPREFIANYAAEPDDERLKTLLYSVQNDAAGKPEVL